MIIILQNIENTKKIIDINIIVVVNINIKKWVIFLKINKKRKILKNKNNGKDKLVINLVQGQEIIQQDKFH
jgi:hypothetical protein